ncbi:MAG: crossover junction endodeoxyribonuclease RuvC [Acidobacteriota bacterium]
MIVVGVDPGSRVTGYGLVAVQGNRRQCVDYGSITGASGQENTFPERLNRIHSSLCGIFQRYSPDVVAVEDVFYAVNVKSALRLGHARGVVLLAAAQFGIPLVEYSPLEVKKAVVGYGRAEKGQIQLMVKRLLNLKESPEPHDAADALAVALCHAFRQGKGPKA